jgi:hypothetical protein
VGSDRVLSRGPLWAEPRDLSQGTGHPCARSRVGQRRWIPLRCLCNGLGAGPRPNGGRGSAPHSWMEDEASLVAEFAVCASVRLLNPSLTTHPAVLWDRACSLLQNTRVGEESRGPAAADAPSSWQSLLDTLTKWALHGIPKTACVSAEAFEAALEADGCGRLAATVAASMARALAFAVSWDPYCLEGISGDFVVSRTWPARRPRVAN